MNIPEHSCTPPEKPADAEKTRYIDLGRPIPNYVDVSDPVSSNCKKIGLKQKKYTYICRSFLFV